MKTRLLALTPLAFVTVATLAPLGACTGDKASGPTYRKAPDEPWRTARPTAGPAPEFKLPAFQRATLKNGLVLLLVEDHALPTVNAAVVVRAGSAHETAKEAGLAELTLDVLDEGAGGLSQLDLANAFAQLGARVETSAGREVSFVRTSLLKKHAATGLGLLASVVEKPTFAAADFDRIRAQRIAAVKQREGEPGAIADSLAASLVFGADHPYGHEAAGTAASLEKLTAARAKKFWTDSAGPKNAALVLVGDLTLDEAKALGEKTLGKWKGTGKAPKAPADPKERAALSVALVDVPGAPQAAIRVGRAVMARGDADESALIVMNEVLGGSFSSRINMKLREEKQWTYGAFTVADRRLGKGPFFVTTDVQTPNSVDAVVEILAQLDAVLATGVTDAELTFAKDSYIKSLPGVLGLPSVQVSAAAQLFAYNLPDDYYAQLVEKVRAVTLDDVKRVAARALVKQDLVVVVVGDKAALEPKLTEKALGTVSVFNRDGTPAK